MPNYVSFLRAVNVGKRRVLMADLRAWLDEAGFTMVETYIQTGNVRVGSGLRSPEKVALTLEKLMADRCGFAVPNIVLTPAALSEVYADSLALPPLLSGEGLRRYVTFLKEAPPVAAARELDAWDVEGERVRVVGRAVHWWLLKTTQDAKLSNAQLERSLGVGTTRDLKVVKALAEKWGS